MLKNLYRGKSNGIWMEGYYVKEIKNIVKGTSSSLQIKHFIYVNNFSNIGNYELARYEIDENTLCQSIGYVDKNNKTIFDKDIVNLEINNKEYKAEVIVNDYGIIFSVLDEDNMNYTLKDINTRKNIAVITNVFDI